MGGIGSEFAMLGMIARILIGTALGALFLVGMALAYANDLLTSQSRQQSRRQRSAAPHATSDPEKQVSLVDETS